MSNKNKKLTREEMFILTATYLQMAENVPESRRNELVAFHNNEARKTKKDIEQRIIRRKEQITDTDEQIIVLQSFFDKHADRETIYGTKDLIEQLNWQKKANYQKIGYLMTKVVGVDKVFKEDGKTGYRLKENYNPMRDTLRAREIDRKLG